MRILCVLALLLGLAAGIWLCFSRAPHPAEMARAVGCLDVDYVASAKQVQAPLCPNSNGLSILPRTFPVSTLFLGYTNHPAHSQFLREVIHAIEGAPTNLAILFPRHEIQDAYEDLLEIKKLGRGQLQMISTPSDEALWAQDYFEVAVDGKTGRPTLIDLPYTNREGELIPAALGLTCDVDVIRQPFYDEILTDVGSGEYGGNIEAFPGNIVLIGNNMTTELAEHLAGIIEQDVYAINVGWLETGHVDELFSLLPAKNRQPPCDFAITYASPNKAFTVLKENNFDRSRDQISPPVHDDLDVNATANDQRIHQCLHDYVVHHRTGRRIESEYCQELIMANNTYSNIILRELETILSLVRDNTGCRAIELLEVPVLFAPAQIQDEYGHFSDLANAINPNGVNNILVNETVFLPKQPYPAMRNEVVKSMHKLGIATKEVEASLAHQLSGGLHCLSNTIRLCQPH